MRSPGAAAPRAAGLGLALALAAVPLAAQERANRFGDPFEAVTQALPGCPVPQGPLLTEAEARAEAHGRVERGTSCYQSGRCRLPNAYLYDREIIPRVRRFILQDPRFAGSSLWVLGQRRWVTVLGCVSSPEQGQALEEALRGIDDVEAVVARWQVGIGGTPPYATAAGP